jgi:hypothetical protein
VRKFGQEGLGQVHGIAQDSLSGAASGPGFVDWWPEWHGVYKQIYFEAVRGGAPTREAADLLGGHSEACERIVDNALDQGYFFIA